MKTNRRILSGLAVLFYAFLYAPILVVIIFSFNASRYSLNWEGFSTQWYETLPGNELALAATRNTLLLAVASTVVATGLGTMLAYGLARLNFPGKRWLSQLLYFPVFVPDIVLAVSLLLFYALVRRWLGVFELGLGTMICGHVTFQIPFVAIVVRSRLAGLDPALEEAAHDLGANSWQAFWRVTFPMMLPGVIAGAMLAFTLSLDDFVVSFFTSGPGSTTLPILIYSSVKRGITPEINALSTIIIVVSILTTLGIILLQRRRPHEL